MRIPVVVSIVVLLCAMIWFAGCGGGSNGLNEPGDPNAPLHISLSPNTFDASSGQATITYSNAVPVSSPSLIVRSGSGATVRSLISYAQIGADTRQATWDGKDGAGQAVAAGSYSVVFSGNTSDGIAIPPATATITVQTSTTTPPPPSDGAEKGQIIEGAGSANFAWLKYAGRKLGVCFKAPKSGTITQITLQWKKSSGYGAGTYGTYTFEIQTNGSGNMPSGTVIGRTTGIKPTTAMDGYLDGAFHFNISASLTAGQIYHLVVTNTDANPGTNWSSPNGMMTRVVPWDGTGNRAAIYESGTWRPWSSQNNPWNTTGGNYVNGEHIPTMLSYSDGTNYGDHYYSAHISSGGSISGSSKVGEYFVWNQASTSISRIGLSVRKSGSTTGSITYHLEKVGSGDIAKGTMSTSNVGSVQTWIYVSLPSAVTLQQGQAYRLWFEAPSGSFYSACVYGEQRPASWLQCGWGGTQGCFITGSGGWSSQQNADLSFSLQ